MGILSAVRDRLRARRARINARDDRLAAADQDIGSRLDTLDWARGDVQHRGRIPMQRRPQ
jgi:hypothetical protein